MKSLSLVFVGFSLVAAPGCGGGSSTPSSSAPARTAAPAPAAVEARPDLFGAPAPSGDYVNRIDDLSRDLVGVARRAPDAGRDFSSDFADLIDNAPPAAALDPLGRSVVDAVQGAQISPDQAKHLANLLYASLNAGRLDAAQQGSLRSALTGALKEIGATDARVTAAERAFDGLTGRR